MLIHVTVLWLGLQAPPTADAAAVLEAACVRCHGGAERRGGLDLTTREALLRGGDSGAAVVPGRAKESLLWRLVTGAEEPAMPRKAERLPPAALAALAAWIDAGAPYARPLRATTAAETHWAFGPLAAPATPGNPIDALAPATAPAADRRTLARRLWFDLIGLPPAPGDVDAFVRDPDPRAYERLVDRLLADPRFGERWARYWLDVARYADSAGYESDEDRPHAWPYRDFVIRALDDDMPFDRFVRWQLAGDEYAPGDPEALAATGFLAAGPSVDPNPTDSKENKEKYRYDELDDVVSTVGGAFLGLTVGCARCHDHKYDPITSREYYQLVAAFIGTRRRDVPLAAAPRALEEWLAAARAVERERRMAALGVPDDDRELLRVPRRSNNPTQVKVYQRWDARLRFTDDELRAALPERERATWARLQAEAAATVADLPRALTVTDVGPAPVPAFLLARGEPSRKVAPVEPGFLAALGARRTPDDYRRALLATLPAPRTTLRRAALAEWLTDVEGGAGRLVARVAVNRLWHHHFGRGLVATASDLGTQGDPPENPALLDALASELVRGGWRLKPLHRMIVTSARYRQRRAPLRLEAEAVRDTLLAVAGTLNPRMFGPPVKPAIPAEAIATRSADRYPSDTPDGPDVRRRSVYVFAKRSVRHPMLEAFDAPDASASCGRRFPTTVPTQALALLNDPWARARAAELAARLRREAGDAPARQVDRAFRLAFARSPARRERAAALRLIARHGLTDFCHALFNTNELVHVD